MNKFKTENYYRELNKDSLCSCDYCRNYYKEVKAAYSELSDHLAGMGVDIEKPFETIPLEPYEGNIEYIAVQYIVIGNGMNNYISENAILRFAIDNGIIDCATIQQQIELKQREEYLKKHKNSIWQDKNGYWKTYINDAEDGKKKRRLLKKKNKSDLEDMIVELYQAEDLNTFKNRYNKWIERQRICGRAGETIYKYKADYKRFFKGYPIETMDIADINDEVLSMHITAVLEEKPIRWRALKGIFGYINGVFKKSIMDNVRMIMQI